MKRINQFTILALFTLFTFSYCTKDKLGEKEELANQQNAEEEETIKLSLLDKGVKIENATKKEGTPPLPNSDLDFQLDESLTEAIQGAGFSVNFASQDGYKGAYIVLKDSEGNSLDNYFDVQDIDNNTRIIFGKGQEKRNTSLFKKDLTSKTDEVRYSNRIKISFNEEIPAGQFCYDICLYDDENNVSQIQSVCVTVEAWGGNANIVGQWSIDRIVYPDGSEETTTIHCSNGTKFEADYVDVIKEERLFNFLEDGNFNITNYSETKNLDTSASRQRCEKVYGEVFIDNSKLIGNWAYNEDKKTIIIVEFEYQDLIDQKESYINIEGEVLTDGYEVSFEGENMVWTITDEYYDLSEGKNIEEITKVYFKRNK